MLKYAIAAPLSLLLLASCAHQLDERSRLDHTPLTVIVLGDAGESNRNLRNNASLITNMHTGQHDGGFYHAMIFLGDNFYNTGLNIPLSDVDGKIKSVLGPFRVPFEALGRENVHAIAGNHDYYARNAIEKSILFGLISISDGPIGLTDRGNARAAAIQWWSYYYGHPADALYEITPGSGDSVQFIFVDSALPLRTDPSSWGGALDSLRRLLTKTKDRPGIVWRILSTHHPFYSLGEHGGYTEWNDEKNIVEYLTQCDKDSNALGFLKNWIDPEDLCAAKYQQYLDSLKAAIGAGGVKIQLVMSGHDHSLQLLYYPERDADCSMCPNIQIVSGAGSYNDRVRFPGPREFTAAQLNAPAQGRSHPGFAQLQFSRDRLRVVFFNANTGNPVNMGNGKTELWISAAGTLLE
jgi:hypothetical protein